MALHVFELILVAGGLVVLAWSLLNLAGLTHEGTWCQWSCSSSCCWGLVMVGGAAALFIVFK